MEQRFGDQRPGRAKDACGRGENISRAGRAATGGGSGLRGTSVCAWRSPRLKGLALRVVLRAAVRCGAYFFALSFFGQRPQLATGSAFCRAQTGVAEDSAPPPALPRRLPRDAERMRAAEELRLFADLWTHAATPLVSVPASLASDSAFPAPGRGLIGTGCPSLESDSVLWTRTSRPPRLAQRSRWPGVTSLGTGRRVSRVGASSGLRRDVLCSGCTVPGIRFRVPGTRVGVPSGKVGGVFPCARTQAGPPVGRAWGAVRAAAFFRARTGGVVASRSVFWKISASWKAATN